MAGRIRSLCLLKPQNALRRNYSNGVPENIKKGREMFGLDDGVPTYLKGGAKDRILLGVTVIGLGLCLVDSAYFLLTMAFVKKK